MQAAIYFGGHLRPRVRRRHHRANTAKGIYGALFLRREEYLAVTPTMKHSSMVCSFLKLS